MSRLCEIGLLFSLWWLPFQNFMVVFGWDLWGSLALSLLSLPPIALALLIADLLLERTAPEVVRIAASP